MRRRVLAIFLISTVFLSSCSNDDEIDPVVQPIEEKPIDLHQFSKNHKGFNLLGKFDVGWSNTGFSEEEFIIIQDLGFNFVRLPLDYRAYTKAGNWNEFMENEVAKIDNAVAWGKQYGVHVCINLHRAPGYCVNEASLPANQDLDLWTDPVAQEAFVNHWAYFANRYKDLPAEEVSFNLVNEPGDMDELSYVNVMQKAINKIHEININRIVFVDGLSHGRELITSLINTKNVIQALHVYDPFTLTHYKAGWVDGSDTWPLPIWPVTDISNYLYGPVKSEYQSSLEFQSDFLLGGEITINVHQVSIQSTLQIKLDDVEIFKKAFVCGPDLGDDWTVINETQWGYQNISNKDYKVTLPANGSRLTISNTAGDWMTINSISIKSGQAEITIIPGNTSWGSTQDAYKITGEGHITKADGTPILAMGGLNETLELAQMDQIPVMVQEFGVYNQTPHDVTLAYLSDVVALFDSYQIGYALWNLDGTFGILNSQRADCSYASYRGKQLDVDMANILQGN